MVSPVVLLTLGGIITNGLLVVYNDTNERMRSMTRERLDIRRGPQGEVRDAESVPPIDQERLYEIGVQLPMLLRRHRLTRRALLVIYWAICVLGLSTIAVGLAVAESDAIAGRVALGLVLAGTIAMIAGLTVATFSLAKSGDAITYAVERTDKFG